MRRYIAYENNCLQCCLAGLLDMPLSEIISRPDIENHVLPWTEALSEWLAEQGYTAMFCDEDPSIPGNIYYIRVLKTKEGKSHGIIARGFEVIHDPKPKEECLESFLYAIILIPLGDKTQQHGDISEFVKEG